MVYEDEDLIEHILVTAPNLPTSWSWHQILHIPFIPFIHTLVYHTATGFSCAWNFKFHANA